MSTSLRIAATSVGLLLLGCTGLPGFDQAAVDVAEAPPVVEPSAPTEPRFPVLDGDLATIGQNDMERVLEQVAWAREQGLVDPTAHDTGVSILPLSAIGAAQLATLRDRRIQFRYCFRKAQQKNPMVNGFLRVDARFEADQLVARGVERAGLTPELQQCVHHTIRRWKLPDAPELVQLLVVFGDPQ
jgi:hypothetical protein